MLIDLVNNIAFLVALVAAGQVVVSHSFQYPVNRQISLGLLFGGVAMLGMVNPVVFSPGVIFDGRTIVLAVAGVVGGPLTGAIGAGMAALYRYQIGGSGVVVGMSVAVLSAMLGVVARAWWQRRDQLPRWFHYLALGVAVQVMQLSAFTQIPNRAGHAFIEQAGWILMIFYPLATVLLCLMFRNFEQQLIDKAALKTAQEARLAAERVSLQRFHTYFDHSIMGLAMTGTDKSWIEVNDALCHTLGYSRAELAHLTWEQITHPDDLAADQAHFNRMLAGEIDSYTLDKRFLHQQGHALFTRLAVSQARKPDGSIDYVLAMVEDISERHRALEQLERERTHLQTLIRALPDLIWLKDGGGRYISCNREFEKFFGAKECDIVGKTDHEFVPVELANQFRQHDQAAMRSGEPTRNQEWITYASDGRRILLETTKLPMRANDGQLLGVLGVGHDITERHSHEQQLERLAHFDTLTELPNRVLLLDRLQQALAQAQRRKTTLAVAYLDLDGFKTINDRYGHSAGDQMLKALSVHMRCGLREVDTLGRLGGDEFVAIFVDLPNIESSLPLLTRLLTAAAEVVPLDGLSLQISGSLGVTYYPQDDAADADLLLRQADQAMYRAKQMGKNRYHVFDAAQDRSIRYRHEQLERLKQALDQREFVLYYQPKVNMRTGEIIGAEALIRWQHPEQGLLPPGKFLPLITDQALVIDLGYWVLDSVMAQIEAWKSAGLKMQVSANIDAIHLAQTDFVERLRALKAAHPTLVDGDLELEVLETSALDDTVWVAKIIKACQAMGIGFALDDFGTGYSSLTYLKQLPAELLKIDQSFVRDMLEQPDDIAILQGILGLAKAFQRRVIAEGVETLAHGELLLRLGCELAQGYAVARPMPAEAVPAWASTWRTDPSWQGLSPVGRDDTAILTAWVEHRAWGARIVRFLQDEDTPVSKLHPANCRFGRWLASPGTVPLGRQGAIQELVPLHLEIHEQAHELILLRQQGQTDAAMARLPAFTDHRDRFLARLLALLD